MPGNPGISRNHSSSHSDLGDVLREAGRLAEAEAEYREAIRLDPDHVYSHTSLGNVLYDAGVPRRAG